MATKVPPLLCELHAHSTWSDGTLSMRALCDLYGRSGFDVLAITDHTTRYGDSIIADTFPDYLREIESEGLRAAHLYGLLVIPGLELTFDHPDPEQAAHAVAVGLRTFVGVADGLVPGLSAARAQGAALIAAHPYRLDDIVGEPRATAAFAARRELAGYVDRFELFNRDTLFPWVAESGLPAVASGDFHQEEHLASWKTLLPCGKDETSVVTYLRSARPAFLTRVSPTVNQEVRAA